MRPLVFFRVDGVRLLLDFVFLIIYNNNKKLCASLRCRGLGYNLHLKKNDSEAHSEHPISYGKGWRAKHRALEETFSTFVNLYDNVVRLLRTLQLRNP